MSQGEACWTPLAELSLSPRQSPYGPAGHSRSCCADTPDALWKFSMLQRIIPRRPMQLKWCFLCINQHEAFGTGSVEVTQRRCADPFLSPWDRESPNCSSPCTGSTGTVLAGNVEFQPFLPNLQTLFTGEEFLCMTVTTKPHVQF